MSLTEELESAALEWYRAKIEDCQLLTVRSCIRLNESEEQLSEVCRLIEDNDYVVTKPLPTSTTKEQHMYGKDAMNECKDVGTGAAAGGPDVSKVSAPTIDYGQLSIRQQAYEQAAKLSLPVEKTILEAKKIEAYLKGDDEKVSALHKVIPAETWNGRGPIQPLYNPKPETIAWQDGNNKPIHATISTHDQFIGEETVSVVQDQDGRIYKVTRIK